MSFKTNLLQCLCISQSFWDRVTPQKIVTPLFFCQQSKRSDEIAGYVEEAVSIVEPREIITENNIISLDAELMTSNPRLEVTACPQATLVQEEIDDSVSVSENERDVLIRKVTLQDVLEAFPLLEDYFAKLEETWTPVLSFRAVPVRTDKTD